MGVYQDECDEYKGEEADAIPQFDQTTNRISSEKAASGEDFNSRLCWRSGRVSTKTSLEIMARELVWQRYRAKRCGDKEAEEQADLAIAQVKVRGDWPLED